MLIYEIVNCKQSKLLKCVNIAITYSFLFTKKFRKSLFPKGVFISLEERTLASIYRSSHQKCSIKKGVLRNFTKFTRKHLYQSLFINKVQINWKRNSDTVFFLWIFWNFWEQLFYKTVAASFIGKRNGYDYDYVYPANIYLFKVNNRNTSIFIVNFLHISHLFLVFI